MFLISYHSFMIEDKIRKTVAIRDQNHSLQEKQNCRNFFKAVFLVVEEITC